MKLKFLFILSLLLAFTISCEEDDETIDGTGTVEFTNTNLFEVENATAPLNVNIGIDTFNHNGGSINVSISGATYGTDYTTNLGSDEFSLSIEKQGLVGSFNIQPLDNSILEGTKTLTITITGVSGSLAVGESNTLTFSILDDEAPSIGVVNFANANTTIQENATTATTINIPFINESSFGGTITLTASGDAVFGTDYTIAGQTSSDFVLTVPAGATSASFDISAIDNTTFDNNKTVVYTISEVTGNLLLGSTLQNTIEINNDEAPPFPLLNFDMASATYNEDAGTVNIAYTLSYATTASTDVELTTSGTANNTDFNFSGSTANPYNFTIPTGTTTGNVSISIVDDTSIEQNETVIVNITNVTGGAIVGPNAQHTINITDNDFVPFNYLETFETVADLDAANFSAEVLATQNLPDNKLFKYNNNAGKYADVNDVTQTSDTGLVVFYNITQDGPGEIDNVVITPQMAYTGNSNFQVDIAYSQAPNFNNANVTFYYSQTYNPANPWNEADWTVIGSETAADMNNDGFGTNVYKRKSMNITSTGSFYISVRVKQTIDNTFSKTQWRLDNFRVDSI